MHGIGSSVHAQFPSTSLHSFGNRGSLASLFAFVLLFLALCGCHKQSVDERALIDAAKSGDIKALTGLLDSGGSVEASNESGRTLVALAALRGNTAIVKLLLARGANPNARDAEGMTPLMWAAFGGSVDSVKALLEKGADPKIKANDGKTVLDWMRPGDDTLAAALSAR